MIICSFAALGQTTEDYLESGIIKQKQQDFGGAIKEYNKAIEVDTNNAGAYYSRALCKIALNDSTSAMNDLMLVIKLDPEFVTAYYARAYLFLTSKKYSEALLDLDKVIDLDPTLTGAMTFRGLTKEKAGDLKGACEDFEQAKKLGDADAVKYLIMYCSNENQKEELSIAYSQLSKEYIESGLLKEEQKDYIGAIEEYSKAIEADSNNAETYYNRGFSKFSLDDDQSALNDFTKSINLDAQSAKAYYMRAIILANNKKYSLALSDINKVIEIYPENPSGWLLRGRIRTDIDDLKGACGDFERAKMLGDEKAVGYIYEYCGKESLILNWAEKEDWEIAFNEEEGDKSIIGFTHKDESITNYTEIGMMAKINGIFKVPLQMVMDSLIKGFVLIKEFIKDSPKAKRTIIEKDDLAEYPWILFSYESIIFDNKEFNQGSFLFYIVYGKQATYVNLIVTKEETLPDDFIKKWSAFFKTGKIIFEEKR